MKTWLVAMILALGNAAMSAERPITIEWSEGPKLPMGLGGHVAAVIGGEIIVAGGSNWKDEEKIWRDEVWVLDEKKGSWREHGKIPAGLTLPAAAVHDDALLLLGGWTEVGTTADIFRCANGKVDRDSKTLPSGRALGGAADIEGTVYLIGGLTDGADFKTAMKNVLHCRPESENPVWSDLAPLPTAIALSATVTLGGKIYVFGGMGPSGNFTADSANALRYDPNQDQWTMLSPLPSARRGCGGTAIDDRYILIVGGCRNEKDAPVMLDEVLAYDTRENRYHLCAPLPVTALCEAAVMKDGKIYIIGGEDKPRHRTDRVIIGTIKKD
jgi:N-acetylneuraminic acid mutarotase